jgi:hypothetical protein
MTAAPKRLRGLASAALLLALALGAAGVLVAVADRYHARVDVTTTGEQRLAPRTRAILDAAAPLGEVEIVVAVDAASIQPWSRRTVNDVLDLFAHSGRVRTSEIDVGSAAGQAEFGRLLDRLMERDRPGIDQHVAAVQQSAAEARAVAEVMQQQLAPALTTLASSLTAPDATARAAKAGVDQWAALLGVASRQLADAAARAVDALSEPDPTLPIPPLAEHEAALRANLDQRADELEALAAELLPLADAGLGDATTGPAAESIAKAARALRDRLARQSDAVARLPRLDVLRVARALGAAEVALVIGPPGAGVTGIDIGALYEPSVVATDGSTITGDVRFQAEELLGSAVAAVLDTSRPIVVLVHAESEPILQAAPFFAGIRERLTRRGIDLAEWVAGRDDEPPTLTELDPDGVRPVVFVTLSPDSAAGARTDGDKAGPEKAAALGRALALLLERRRPVFVNLNPSILPSYGETDPVAAPLAALGIQAATGTPLLRETADTRSRQVQTDIALRGPEGEQPILTAVRNLRVVLSWPVALTNAEDAAVRETALLTIDDRAAWGESQWHGLWRTPRDQRGLLPDAPVFDQGADRRDGPWTVADAYERADQPAGARDGRIVVVGSNSWFADPIAFERRVQDGRVVPVNPGNAELFEAAVLWLAGEDELVAQSAGARATPLVGDIASGRLTAVRWALVAGLPLATLILGIAWRVARG